MPVAAIYSAGVESLGTDTIELTGVAACGVTSAGWLLLYSVGVVGLAHIIPAL